jgi:hypothetical protein
VVKAVSLALHKRCETFSNHSMFGGIDGKSSSKYYDTRLVLI